MWVCVDKSEDGKFLADCESCQKGKAYSADYNAAAHLRRKHFVAKPKVRGKSSRNPELRGGKSGGAFPPMDVLKQWMKEVEVDAETEYVGASNSPAEKDESVEASPLKTEVRKRSLEDTGPPPPSPSTKMRKDERVASEHPVEPKTSPQSPSADKKRPWTPEDKVNVDVEMPDMQATAQSA